jgi:pilus assembly protein Flp/PilA
MVQMKLSILKNFYNDEGGATAIEYGLMAGLISLVIFVAAQDLATYLISLLGKIEAAIKDAK